MLLPHQQAFRGLCAFSVNCTFPFKLFSFYLIHKITRGPCCGDHINPLSPFHSVDHACELLQPHGTLLKYQTLMKYQTPHADLFFHSMQSRNRTTVSAGYLGLKRCITDMNLNWETIEGNQCLQLFACFSLDICGSDFHVDEYLKMFVFLQSMFISKAQIHKVNSLFSEQGKKWISLISRQCMSKLTDFWVCLESLRPNNQLCFREANETRVHGTYNSWAGRCRCNIWGARPVWSRDEPSPRQHLCHELTGSLAGVFLVIIYKVHPKPFQGRTGVWQNK